LFVSVRKYDGEAKQWGPYSDPAVWSYAGRDGQPGVVDGYAIDLTNENLPIGTSGGNVTHYEGHSLIQVYHNNVPVTEFTASIGTITRSDNTIGGTINATVNNNTKMITVTLENVTNFDGKSFEVPVTVNVGGADHVVTLTGYGVNSGVDGQSIELCTNVAAIRCDYTGTTCVPNSITPTVKITSGTSQQVEYGYSNNLGYSFEYSYVDGATISSRAAVNGPVLIAGYHDAIIFYLKYTDANNITTEIDSELVPFVKDGAPGIKGADFINYAIDVQQSTMVVEDGNVSGTITYKVFKDDEQFGANGFEHTDGETVVVKVNDAVRTATYGNNVWTVTV